MSQGHVTTGLHWAAAPSVQPCQVLNGEGHKKGCRCKRSKCQKKYCECFQAGVKCNPDICQCDGCENWCAGGWVAVWWWPHNRKMGTAAWSGEAVGTVHSGRVAKGNGGRCAAGRTPTLKQKPCPTPCSEGGAPPRPQPEGQASGQPAGIPAHGSEFLAAMVSLLGLVGVLWEAGRARLVRCQLGSLATGCPK